MTETKPVRKRAARKSAATRTTPQPHKRVTGIDREAFAAQVREQYDSGMSVRAIATLHSRSYGNIHRLLNETGTTMRKRGGSHS